MNRLDGRLCTWSRQFGDGPPLRLLAQTPSTQDVARRWRGTTPSAIVAARQTAGRGRLGRRWVDDRGLGVAMTLVLADGEIDASCLSLACGIAALDALRATLGTRTPPLGLRWPNDIMLVDSSGRGVRKLGGVLIERSQDRVLAGIGINVHQQPESFPPHLRDTATSLACLHAACSRPRLAGELARSVLEWARRSRDQVTSRWKEHDALRGVRTAFDAAGTRVEGVVERVEPLDFIEMRTPEGPVRVPVATAVRSDRTDA
jgi:BirA family biotin operon repressor/biotin-[acetyl-CoA-carboxylase] ligase